MVYIITISHTECSPRCCCMPLSFIYILDIEGFEWKVWRKSLILMPQLPPHFNSMLVFTQSYLILYAHIDQQIPTLTQRSQGEKRVALPTQCIAPCLRWGRRGHLVWLLTYYRHLWLHANFCIFATVIHTRFLCIRQQLVDGVFWAD